MDTTGYIALSRQIALERHMTSIANNIANANTSGYRAYEGQNPGQRYVVDLACLFCPTNTYRLTVVSGQLKVEL